MFDQVSVILSHPSHPGNIGATARAMKTMGFSNLILINPKEYPHCQATAMASGAHDILQKAHVVSSLSEALAPFHYIIGASARHRSLSWPISKARDMAKELTNRLNSSPQKVALLFGNETSGLSNDELHACDAHVTIDANEAYSSLNLSQAVQVITYELREHFLAAKPLPVKQDACKATHAQMEGFYEHLSEVLTHLDIFNPKQPRQLIARLQRLFNRAEMDETEVNILRGIFKAILKKKPNFVIRPETALKETD